MIEHLLCVLAVVAMTAAATRAAFALGARGLEIAVAAAPLAVAAAIAEAMALGLVRLGGSAWALAGAAGLTWLAASRLPAAGVVTSLRAWWGSLDRRSRLVSAGAAGIAFAWTAWVVKYPALGIDPITYHLTESIRWVQEGTPGTVEEVQYEFPSGWYPITNEVFVGWLTGLGSSLAPQLLWTPVTAVLFCAALWLGLRRLGVPRTVAALAPLSVLLIPVTATQLLGPHTDLPAFTWLAVTAALAVCAARTPGLLVPALLAAALAVGTKTTTAPLALIALVSAGWFSRSRLRLLMAPLAAAAVLGSVVGLTWYVRNLIAHGSPLWPFLSGPWGDPVPGIISITDVSFLSTPGASLGNDRWIKYLELLAGGLVTLALGLVMPLVRRGRQLSPAQEEGSDGRGAGSLRSRPALAAAGAAAFATFAWLNAPFTGVPDDPVLDLSLTTTRYLVPALTAGTVAFALTARGRARGVIAVLAACCLWSYAATASLNFPGIPSLPTLAFGALLGVGTVWVLGRRASSYVPGRSTSRRSVLVGAAGVLVAAASLSVIGHDFGRRQGGQTWLASAGVVTFMANEPRFTGGEDPVHFAPTMLAPLAGDSLDHTIDLIPRTEPCDRVLARRGWIVIGTPAFADRRPRFSAADCLAGERAEYVDASYRVYYLGAPLNPSG